MNSVNGQGKFDEFTKNDIDDVIKMFQGVADKSRGIGIWTTEEQSIVQN